MDHQRTTFYGMRQKVLRGQDVDRIIWDMIGEAIADAVDKYITQDYVAATVAEWARVNFDVDDRSGRSARQAQHRRAGSSTSRTRPAPKRRPTSPPRSANSWARRRRRRYARLGHQGPAELGDEPVPREPLAEPDPPDDRRRGREQACASPPSSRSITATATGLMKYLEPNFAEQELANWAKEKFGIEIKTGGIRSRSARAIAFCRPSRLSS